MKQYAQLMVRVYERIKHDPKAYAEFLELTDWLITKPDSASDQESSE